MGIYREIFEWVGEGVEWETSKVFKTLEVYWGLDVFNGNEMLVDLKKYSLLTATAN